ncbi:MAG: hypothetical protein J0L58_16930 [Burkholderiales bacterium]|nr:hypothetical protein [Burkholderiales bacterium]
MKLCHSAVLSLALLALGCPALAQNPVPASSAASAAALARAEQARATLAQAAQARAAWAFFAGRFEIDAAPAAKVPAGTVWTLAPVLGGKYLEMQAVAYETDFRVTLAWDSLRKHYAMSLLDSGSGVLDVYKGPLQDGELVLTNDHGFRVRIQSQPDGWIWQYERMKDGNWLPSGPPVKARRVDR